MIFSRRRGTSGRHARDDRRRAARARQETPEAAVEADEEIEDIPPRGPYDISAAPKDVPRLDLGSLHIPAVPGVELRVKANPDGSIDQVLLAHGDNLLQLGVFAAPRSEGIWDETRAQMRQSLTSDGAPVQEIEGEYGVELRARVPGPEGPVDVRFVGIDGPRWMVRAAFYGAAATDPSAAGPLAESLSGLVVDRGQEAKPVGEALPLRLPREFAERAGTPASAGPAGSAGRQAG